MPAFRVTTSHWLGLKLAVPPTGLRTGQLLSHAITSDLEKLAAAQIQQANQGAAGAGICQRFTVRSGHRDAGHAQLVADQ